MLGLTIGKYRVLRKIGEGGMGAVYVAEHTLLGRNAALKVLLPELSSHKSVVKRFFDEARVVTQISDPGIVQVFDYGVHTDGSAYIVMELLEGETVGGRLKRLGRFAPADALRVVRQVATSLSAAHAKGVVHRDLKPDNIFIIGDAAVTGGERAKILDFGIAKLSEEDPDRNKTRTGTLIGTPVYMSPEQCRGAGSIDHRSDLYSLGCVLFCMLTGRPPFDAPGSGDIIAMHLREPPPAPSTHVPGISPEVDAVVLCCLAKSPDDRPQSALALAQMLGALEASGAGYTPLPFAVPSGYGHGPHPSFPSISRVPTPPPLTPAPAHYATPAHGVGIAAPLAPDAPTTLSSATGQPIGPAPRGRRIAIIGGLAAAAIVAGVVILTMGGAKDESRAAPAAGAPTEPAAASTPPPPPVKPSQVEPAPTSVEATSPVVEPEPVGEPASTTVVTPTAKPDKPAKPATTAVAKPDKPAIKPIVKPIVKPVTKPVAKPTRPTAKPAVKPTTQKPTIDRGD